MFYLVSEYLLPVLGIDYRLLWCLPTNAYGVSGIVYCAFMQVE